MQINRFCLYPISFVVGLWLSSCSTKQDSGSTSIKFQQYYVQGEQLFIQHCSNCHQKDGKGLGLLYPPVNQSDFIEENFEKVICIIRNGIKGDIVVNGNTYNKEMPPMPALTDLEIAEITTYLYNTWGREKGIIEVKDASQILTNCVE
jgi:mono/diheme cytochrome c family protein